MIDCKEVCKNKYMNVPVCEIYENMNTNHVYTSVDELDKILLDIQGQDYTNLHDWFTFCEIHELDAHDQTMFNLLSCEDKYYDFLTSHWSTNNKKMARVKWLAGLIEKYKEPYYTESGDYEQIVIIPVFHEFRYYSSADEFCISYRVDAGRFFE